MQGDAANSDPQCDIISKNSSEICLQAFSDWVFKSCDAQGNKPILGIYFKIHACKPALYPYILIEILNYLFIYFLLYLLKIFT